MKSIMALIRGLQLLWSACVGSLVAQAQELPAQPQRVEKQVEITVAAEFQFYGRDLWRFLILSNEQHQYRISWPSDPRFNAASVIQSNKVYTFTVVEEPSTTITVPVTNTIVPQVVRIRQENKVIYDLEQCEVHHTAMERLAVPIVYGLRQEPGTNEPNLQVDQQLFPHRREEVDGGCVTFPTSPKTKDVYVCRRCQAAYENWKSEHKKAEN